jgi:hypothetical protein
MKVALAALGAMLFAGPLSHLACAEAQIGVFGLGQVTIGQASTPASAELRPSASGLRPSTFV